MLTGYRCTLPLWENRPTVDWGTRLEVLDWARGNGFQFAIKPRLAIDFMVRRHDGLPLDTDDLAVFSEAAVSPEALTESEVALEHAHLARAMRRRA